MGRVSAQCLDSGLVKHIAQAYLFKAHLVMSPVHV